MGDFFNLTMEVKTLVEEHGRFRASLNNIRSHDDTDSRKRQMKSTGVEENSPLLCFNESGM